MLHLVLYGLLAIIVAGGLFLVASRFLPAGEQIAPPLRDEPPWLLPADRLLQAEDVDTVRLPVALRGYRFAETDTLLDRLAAELRARDAEIARLRGHAAIEPPEASADDATAAAEAVAEQPPLPLETPEPAAADGMTWAPPDASAASSASSPPPPFAEPSSPPPPFAEPSSPPPPFAEPSSPPPPFAEPSGADSVGDAAGADSVSADGGDDRG